MPLYPTSLEAGEDYPTTEQLLNVADLTEAPVRVPGWKVNGKPVVLRVKALSLEQKEKVERESTRADGTVNRIAEIEATFREGCVVPRFDVLTASRLRHKNPAVLEMVANFIWTLSTVDQELIDATVQKIAGARAEPQP